MDEPLYGLTTEDRDLLRRVTRLFNSGMQNIVQEGENGFTHRASDVMVVKVETAIPMRPPATDPTEFPCTAWDVYEDAAEDYTLPILDRADVAIPVGTYFAVLDRNGNWGVVLGGEGGPSLQICVFNLSANLSPGGTVSAAVVTSNVVGLTGSIDVVDAMGKYRSYSGARGLAINTGAEWWIIELEQHPLIWTGVLTSNTHDFTVSPGGGIVLGSFANQVATITYGTRESRTGFPFSKFPPTNGFVNNTYNCIGRIGDVILVVYDNVLNQNHIIDVIPGTTRAFQFKFTADRANGAYTGGNITAFEGFQAIFDSRGAIPTAGDVRDLYAKSLGAKSGQPGIAVWNFKDGVWDLLTCQTQATIVSGTITNSSPSGSISLGSLIPLNGMPLSVSTLSVSNYHNYPSWSAGQKLTAIMLPTGGWIPLEKDLSSTTPVQLRINGTNFQISYDGGVNWTTWATGTTCP